MKKLRIIHSLMLLLVVIFIIVCDGVALSTTVEVSGREILVDGTPFIIKGVGYQPTPIGYYPWDVDVYNFGNYERDLPLLRALGSNTIRTWGTVENWDFLDACYNNGIYVIMGFWVDHSKDFSNDDDRQAIKDDFSDYVNTFKDHPAVLMWLPGGEINLHYNNKADWYSLLNELAQVAHDIEGSNYHPVTTDNAGIVEIGESNLGADDISMDALDVWGATIYLGSSFGTLFTDYAAKSIKPFWIAEFGADAWDHINNQEYQETQASFVGGLWDEIAANSDVCSGGAVFEYNDEWWKNEEMVNPSQHDAGPWQRADQPDGWSDEEYYGIVSVENNGDNPDSVSPRQLYFALQEKWRDVVPVLTAKVVGSDSSGRVYNIVDVNNYKVIVYAKTDKYYIQPWAGEDSHADINSDGLWNMSYTHEGDIYTFLVREEHISADTMTSPMTIDGVDVFAEAYGGYSNGEVPPTDTEEVPPPDNNGGSKGAGSCFIATAAFGTPIAEEVKILKRFRDQYLQTNVIGREFVAFYYEHGPAWAEYISDKENLKAMVRMGLRPIIWFSKKVTDDK